MQPDDNYLRWVEALCGALVALGFWIWRVASRMQSYDEQLKTMQAAIKAEQNKRSLRDGQMFARLEDLKVTQAVQTEKIENIEKTCAATNKAIVDILADRLPGGNRKNDPPAGGAS